MDELISARCCLLEIKMVNSKLHEQKQQKNKNTVCLTGFITTWENKQPQRTRRADALFIHIDIV